MAIVEEDKYRILGMFNDKGEKMDWIPRAPRLSSLYGMGLPHGDLRGFVEGYRKGEKIYIVAVKVHCRDSCPEGIEFLTGWGLVGQRICDFPLISENVPNEVKNAAKAYLLDWLGWFKGKKQAREMIEKKEIEWKSIPEDDPVNQETEDYFYMRSIGP